MYTKFLLVLCLLFSTVATAEELVEMVQVAPGITLETTIFKPKGPGPFPLVIMNHGKDGIPTRLQSRVDYSIFSNEFLRRGYAVILPMRRGFAKSSGDFQDGGCDLSLSGKLQAEDIELTLNYFSKQPWVDKNRVIIAGQSFGGLATVAFGSKNAPGVLGTINFAGGLKFFWGICQWKRGLVTAMINYGATSKIPTLWFYGATDSFFDPELAREMFAGYTWNGAPGKLITEFEHTYTNDSHGLIGWTDGPKFWWPETEKFLLSLGLPVAVLVAE